MTIASELYGSTDIPMHGVSDVVTISATGTNEATIDLTRDLAKVELTAVTLNMNYLDGEGKRYGDYISGTASFKFLSASKTLQLKLLIIHIQTQEQPLMPILQYFRWSWKQLVMGYFFYKNIRKYF